MKKEDLKDRIKLNNMDTTAASKTHLLKKRGKYQVLDEEGRKRVNFACKADLWDKVNDYAYTHRITITEAMEKIISAYMSQRWNMEIIKRRSTKDVIDEYERDNKDDNDEIVPSALHFLKK